MRVDRAIDLYMGELARRGKSPSTRRSYERLLFAFTDTLPVDAICENLRLEDFERYLNRWIDSAPSTLASGVSLMRGFAGFLLDRGYTDQDFARHLKRPRRQRPEDTDVTSVTSQEVERMFEACENWQEILCLGTAIYLGARRAALARVRRSDVDLNRGLIRFLEKGNKVAVKPVANEYLAILRLAEQDGIWAGPDDYLIPNRRKASVRRSERSDKVIWETIKGIARRAGVKAHVHALRAAFAVQFDDAHPDRVIALKELMGHSRIETTLVYLRRKDKAKDMEAVRDLSWAVPSELRIEAHTGFEPVMSESSVPAPIRRRLEQIRTRADVRG